MSAPTDAGKRPGFLARLRQDESGNVIAIMAAAIFPAIGIIGGGVDMSRIYLTRTSLQAACDAGALMGRRTMGSSTWATNDGRANERAEQLFDTNFGSGVYASENLSRSFTESGGTVTGRASVEVPMAMMSVFGIDKKEISVTCTAEMRIPASDIMFVLDTTGSMNCPDDNSIPNCSNNGGVEAPNAKIKGLRTAAGCFYEALAKQNVPIVTPEDCDEEDEPAGATSDVRLRFGFVPYASNVNVGKLLPLNYIANQWTYQSREATFEPTTDPNAYDATYGAEGAPVQTSTAPQTAPGDTSWTNLTTNLNPHPGNGQQYSYNYQRANSGTACVTGIPSFTSGTTGNLVANGQSPTTPTYPQSSVTKYYYRTNTGFTYEYRYNATQTGNGSNRRYYCQLQRRTVNQSSTRINYSATVPITWAYNPTFLRWTYKPTTFNISGLKDTANNGWNSSVNLPIGNSGTNRSVTWNGCIEERRTARIVDGDPSDNWDPIPETAFDMDIELAPDPSDAATLWGPLLPGAIYTKYRYDDGWDESTTNFQTSDNRTYQALTYAGNSYYAGTVGENCPTQAQLYEEMGATAFSNYMAGLVTGGSTYHDIGLLWGARLMAPNGIFSAVTSDADTWVERHMVFMTDGDTSVNNLNYTAHGVEWWDRRQNDGNSAASNDWLKANVNARTQAICDWVKDENITLWVVAFGSGITQATKDNLEDCASEGRFFDATDTDGLVSKFKTIANQISALRLTQ
jgi:Flp pilus assembly protein TadG